jgi:hypothetical protein
MRGVAFALRIARALRRRGAACALPPLAFFPFLVVSFDPETTGRNAV